MNENIIKTTMYGIYAGLIALFQFLGLGAFEMLVLTILMIFDVITGISKQWRINKQGITSNRLIVGIVAKMLILLCVFSLALAIKGIGFEFITADYLRIALALLIGGELYSIFANVYTFNTKQELPEFDVVSKFLGGTVQMIKDFLDKIIPHK